MGDGPDERQRQLRWYGRDGERRSGGSFPSNSAALKHYRDVIGPRLGGAEPVRDLTLSEFAELYLERHKVGARRRTIG